MYRMRQAGYGLIAFAAFLLFGCQNDGSRDKNIALLIAMDGHVQYSSESYDVLIDKMIKEYEEDSLIDTSGTRHRDIQCIKRNNKEVVDLFKGIRSKLIDGSGGYIDGDQLKGYAGALDSKTVSEIMVGEEGLKDGHAYELKAKLNSYIDSLNNIMRRTSNKERKFDYVALDAKDDYCIIQPEMKRWDFAALNFQDVTLVVALLKLSMLEEKMLDVQGTVLSYLINDGKVFRR